MWRWMFVLCLMYGPALMAQKKWDGGGNDPNWNNELNWFPDGVPSLNDDVLLDHSFLQGTYQVDLPAGAVTITVRSIVIQPSSGKIILTLPSSNTANPGLSLAGTGDGLVIHNDGVFRNGSGAGSGSGISVAGSIRINNGGRYIHQTARTNAGIIDKLSTQAGTEKGIFEFDVPGTAGYTVSLTGNIFGSLCFNAATAGGVKSYSGSGSGTLSVRGDLIVERGAQVTSTLTADIVVGGDLVVEGRLSLNPSTSGTVSRSLRFTGKDVKVKGAGTVSMNAAFRNIEVARNSFVYLERPLQLPQASNSFICRGGLSLAEHIIDGPGIFQLMDSATLVSGHEHGIASAASPGNIRTASRQFSARSTYIFNAPMPQWTGDEIPDTIASLGVNNPSGLQLSKTVFIADSLILQRGKINSTSDKMLILGTNMIRSGLNNYGQIDEGSEISYVTGPVGLDITEGSTIIAPIGADTVFAPLKLQKTDPGNERCIIQYMPQAYPASNLSPMLVNISDREYWSLQQRTSSRLMISMSFRPWSFRADQDLIPVPAVYNGIWTEIKGTSTGTGYGWLSTDTAANNFDAIAIGSMLNSAVLPVRIASFSIGQESGRMKLAWTAEEEGRELRYEIERSSDGRTFTVVGNVYSSGKYFTRHEWFDLFPFTVNYYRVKMIGQGIQDQSKVIRKIMGQDAVKIFPNPAGAELQINFPGSRSKYEMEIVSFNGTVCKKFVCNTATCRIWVGDLKKGLYLVRLKDQSGSITLPFTKD